MASVVDPFDVMLNPAATAADIQASYERILKAVKSPETAKSAASQENIGKLALILVKFKTLGVSILSGLTETEAGKSALENAALAARSGQRCWVQALVEVIQSTPSVIDDAMGILVRFASRSSKCAASAPVLDTIPFLLGLLRETNRKCVVLSLGMLCVIARSSATLAEQIAAGGMHGTVIKLMRTWDKTSMKELFELVACLAALSQNFAENFIKSGGLDDLCKRGQNSVSPEEIPACAHALETLTRGSRMEAIPDQKKDGVLDTLLKLAVDATNKNVLVKDLCGRALLNFIKSEYAMKYIVSTNKIHGIDVSQKLSSLEEFSKEYRSFESKLKDEAKKSNSDAVDNDDNNNINENDKGPSKIDDESKKRPYSNDDVSKKDNDVSKKDGKRESGKENGDGDDCVVTGGTAPPCKRPAVEEGTMSTPLLMLPERAFLPEPPSTPIIPKDFSTSAKPPSTFEEAFRRLELPASVFTMCDKAARLACEDLSIKSKLTLEEARAIALFTVTRVPGGGNSDIPAVTIAKIFKSNNWALLEKWEPYIALLWTAVNNLKFGARDGYCWTDGDVDVQEGKNVFFPTFFCTTGDQKDIPPNTGKDWMHIFYMKQVPAYDITRFAVPLDEKGTKAKEFFITFPGCIFEVERCTVIGNYRKMVTVMFKNSIYI